MTYEQVINVFKDDLKQEPCIEVVKTRWRYIRVFYEEPYESSFEAVLCRKPEDLFQELLEIVLAGREDLLLKQSKKGRGEVAQELRRVREYYMKKIEL